MREFFLAQHSEAVAEDVDPQRPLTERGREEVDRVARRAAAAGVRLAAVYHSGKLRAAETAAILASRLAPGEEPQALEGLAPKDDPRIVRERLEALGDSVALVGHLPHLSRLLSLLLADDPGREILAFRQGGLVRLVEDDGWRISWVLTPELAR